MQKLFWTNSQFTGSEYVNTVGPVAGLCLRPPFVVDVGADLAKRVTLFPGKRGRENAMSQSDEYDHEILLQFNSAFPTRTEVQQIQEMYQNYRVRAVDAEEL